MDSLSEEVKDVAEKIGLFYLKKNNGNFSAAEDEIINLQIVEIEVNESEIIITASRVGLLIGRRGENLDALVAHLQKKVKLREEENCLLRHLIPEPPYENYWGEDEDV